jgi:peptidoglycan hydrolase-like protein with peptidoglycan-binding domain
LREIAKRFIRSEITGTGRREPRKWNALLVLSTTPPPIATYPVETAVEVALQKLGLYTGPIDGNAASCAGAIEQYQMQNSMPVTGTITPELLTALGIQASFQ